MPFPDDFRGKAARSPPAVASSSHAARRAGRDLNEQADFARAASRCAAAISRAEAGPARAEDRPASREGATSPSRAA
jgi:hypothetical protein